MTQIQTRTERPRCPSPRGTAEICARPVARIRDVFLQVHPSRARPHVRRSSAWRGRVRRRMNLGNGVKRPLASPHIESDLRRASSRVSNRWALRSFSDPVQKARST